MGVLGDLQYLNSRREERAWRFPVIIMTEWGASERRLSIKALLHFLGDDHAIDDHPGAMRHGFEGIAIKQGQVSLHPGFQGSHPVGDAKQLSGRRGAAGEGDAVRKAVGHGEGGFEMHYPRLGNIAFVS